MAPRSTYRISIRQLETYAYHGVPDHEQATGHRYRLDIELIVEGIADLTDDIRDTVDYGAVAQEALRVVTETQVRTLERLARTVAEAILATFTSVRSVKISIEKPFPPAPVVAKSMGVTLSLERDGKTSHHSS